MCKEWVYKTEYENGALEPGPEGEFFCKEAQRDTAAKGPGEKSHGAVKHLSAQCVVMTEGLTLRVTAVALLELWKGWLTIDELSRRGNVRLSPPVGASPRASGTHRPRASQFGLFGHIQSQQSIRSQALTSQGECKANCVSPCDHHHEY